MDSSGGQDNPFKDYFRSTVWDLTSAEAYHGILFFNRDLDFATQFGVIPGSLTEVCGINNSGRTCLCVKLCVSVCVPSFLWGVDGESIYLDSRQMFHPRLVERLVTSTNSAMKDQFEKKNFALSTDDVLSRIHYVRIITVEEFVAKVEFLKEYLKIHPRVRLIVVDSIAMLFHTFSGSSIQRVKKIMETLMSLDNLAAVFNIAVVIVNDMTTRVSPCGTTSRVIPALGVYFYHKISYRIVLSRTPNGKFAAELKKNFKNANKTFSFNF
ncbi:DNA repair protein RAD51 homolog 3-like [Phlebotomus argentipes]|uniref:DNA repair protein RAD51 homolog 3-like n=1 Tax=Phlebotomus argentipes TaxID=94469 RepID=UPI002892AFC9|nr:DNA repair protein RAD51 homolog 3-like [Phlebotomus argentipes]